MSVAKFKDAIILTEEQIQVLDGAMLGDGCLHKNKSAKNAQFTYTSKSYQHVKYVAEYFKDYLTPVGIKEYSFFDERTNKEYKGCNFRTHNNMTFTNHYNRWYKDKKKHISHDLVLTPLMCLIWYIGDGGICHNKYTENIKLSTHCFPKEEQEKILLPQLKQFDASLMKASSNQYIIYIPHRKEKDFLNFIGECPFTDYAYKWNYAEYKNKMPTNHTHLEKEFCKMYSEGNSYYAIAKEFNIEPNAVKYYLIKNNIYKYKSDQEKRYENAIVQYDNGDIIAVYPSMSKASKCLNTSLSYVSLICSGKRLSDKFVFVKFNELSSEIQQYIIENEKDYFKD